MASAALQFQVLRNDPATAARLGSVNTPHGAFDTPAFMPVGTRGTVKGVLPDHLRATGAQIILANTYHLMLRPGEKTVAELGDLHRFMGWNGPILTDSGGFQVFSLAELNKITDEGVDFKSHIDGAMVHLSPERSMEVQNALGADIIMMFDECPAADAPLEYHAEAVERTLRWAHRCVKAHQRPGEQALFGIVQGGTNEALRAKCATALVELDLPGYALGGLAVGEGFEAMRGILEKATSLLPENKPRYLMGVGYPRDIIAGVANGIDMFDCVLPTRNGRNGFAFTLAGAIRLRNTQYSVDTRPIDEKCDCYACRHFTRGAIRHYFFAGEMLGPILVSVHNIRFYQSFMADIRKAITEGRFAEFRETDARATMSSKC